MICISNRVWLACYPRPLLEQYWQRRSGTAHAAWLRWHQRLRRRASRVRCGWRRCIWMSMPAILSIRESGLRLIDWEYAGDGDIALELAAVWTALTSAAELAGEYARRAPSTRAALAAGCTLASVGIC
jgi:thiamine kinase